MMKATDSIEGLLREAYSETHKMLKNPELESVVKDGLLISYGPPIPEPDLLLLSFQGGGADQVVYEEWPSRLLYLDDENDFGKALRSLCYDTGLSASLESSTMAFPAVFPQAHHSESTEWTRKTGPHSVWRRHSVNWVTRLVDAIQPKVVMVFRKYASDTFGIRWQNEEYGPGRRGQIFGLSTFQGAPAVYCHHLSQGYAKPEALKCFEHAKRLISERS